MPLAGRRKAVACLRVERQRWAEAVQSEQPWLCAGYTRRRLRPPEVTSNPAPLPSLALESVKPIDFLSSSSSSSLHYSDFSISSIFGISSTSGSFKDFNI